MMMTDERYEELTESRKNMKRVYKRKKREMVNSELRQTEIYRNVGRTWQQFQGIRKLRSGSQPRLTMVKSSNAKLLVGEE